MVTESMVLPNLVALHRREGTDGTRELMLRFHSANPSAGLVEFLEMVVPKADTVAVSVASALCRREWSVVTLLEECYPPQIRATLGPASPPLLYFRGDLSLLKLPSVAIIGTRRPSAVGRAAARSWAGQLAECGIVVVSGNAPGIDATAHETALSSGGATIVFPPASPDLFQASFRILDGEKRVLILSPFLPGHPTEKWHFHQRNELVAAHCDAAIVAETGSRGGTLNTISHLRRLQTPWYLCELPADSARHDAHKALSACSAGLLPTVANKAAVDEVWAGITSRRLAICHAQAGDLLSGLQP
ncbi:MAG: DNA-protecting protein DprA [Candidatus Sumerlaeaceae bacterium]|nr:DNA-protecting protein DprA [Candidatus Sumerlaeaceae bacterium]